MNMITAAKLQEMKNAGGAQQRQHRADGVLEELREMLLEDEYCQVSMALSHYRSGEGTHELYAVCNRLIQKYQGQHPPRTSRICL